MVGEEARPGCFPHVITILTEFGVESRLEKEDYLQGIKNLDKVW
jgi:predicted Ser/Thr protein kinase